MHCPACGFRYYHNCAAAVAGLIETPGGIVIVKRAADPGKGLYDLPGGFVDYGETFEAALRREVGEELGVSIRNLAYFCSFPNVYIFDEVTYFTTDAVFTCTLPDEQGQLCPGGEIKAVEILPPESIDPLSVAFDSIRAALAKYIQMRGSRAL